MSQDANHTTAKMHLLANSIFSVQMGCMVVVNSASAPLHTCTANDMLELETGIVVAGLRLCQACCFTFHMGPHLSAIFICSILLRRPCCLYMLCTQTACTLSRFIPAAALSQEIPHELQGQGRQGERPCLSSPSGGIEANQAGEITKQGSASLLHDAETGVLTTHCCKVGHVLEDTG